MSSAQKHYYQLYGDVLQVDSTYKTNINQLPFLHFVVKTNENCIRAVAFCLLSFETTEDYSWALKQLLLACENRYPRVILTDEDTAFPGAIKEVFPLTLHHLCKFHLESNLKLHYGAGWSDDEKTDFKSDWKFVVESRSEHGFKTRFERLLQKLQRWHKTAMHAHLLGKKSTAEKWALCYRERSAALGVSTQGVESAHATVKSSISKQRRQVHNLIRVSLQCFKLQHEQDAQRYRNTDHIVRRRKFESFLEQIYESIINDITTRYSTYALLQLHSDMTNAYSLNCQEISRNTYESMLQAEQELIKHLPSDLRGQGNVMLITDVPERVRALAARTDAMISRVFPANTSQEGTQLHVGHHLVVYCKTDGSFACSCSHFALHGLLCVHFFVAYRYRRAFYHQYLIHPRWLLDPLSVNESPHRLTVYSVVLSENEDLPQPVLHALTIDARCRLGPCGTMPTTLQQNQGVNLSKEAKKALVSLSANCRALSDLATILATAGNEELLIEIADKLQNHLSSPEVSVLLRAGGFIDLLSRATALQKDKTPFDKGRPYNKFRGRRTLSRRRKQVSICFST